MTGESLPVYLPNLQRLRFPPPIVVRFKKGKGRGRYPVVKKYLFSEVSYYMVEVSKTLCKNLRRLLLYVI